MKIGLVQTSPVFGDKTANRREIEALVGNKSAHLWVMTELALTGYEFRNREEIEELAEPVPDGETVRWLTEFCAARNCHAVIGLAERAGSKLYNSAVLTGPGGVLIHYRKLHLFDEEKNRFDPGDLPFAVADIGGCRTGVMICFDWRYPESSRTLAMLGAQVVAHPSNLVMPHCQQAMITRALENHVCFVTTNRVGTEARAGRSVTFTGESQIISASGERLAKAARSEPDCLIADVSPEQADDKWVTPHNHAFNDRRPEFYK